VKDSKILLMTSRFEGTPMIALESIALGTPVVCTRTDGLTKLIDDGINGYIYDTDDDAVEFIDSLYKDDNKLIQLRFKTEKSFTSKNDFNKYIKSIDRIYEELK